MKPMRNSSAADTGAENDAVISAPAASHVIEVRDLARFMTVSSLSIHLPNVLKRW
jgi:hypothetical protein